MPPPSPSEASFLYAVESVGDLSGSEVFWGVRPVEHDAVDSTPHVLTIDATTKAQMEFQIDLHINSSNYSDDTICVVGVIVGGGHPAQLSSRGPDASTRLLREIDTTILFIAVAGRNVSAGAQIQDGVLMYQPLGVTAVRPKSWWQFWRRG